MFLMIRTTITLDENTFKEAKKYAIDTRSAFGNLVSIALKNYLQGRGRKTHHKFDLKIYRMGKVTGSLSRSEIYEDI